MKNTKSAEDIRSEIDKLIKNGWDMINTDSKKAQRIVEKIKSLSQKNGCELGTAHGMLLMARIHVANGDYIKAADLSMQGWEIMNRLDDLDGKIKADYVMAFMSSSQGNLEKALSYYQDGLKIMKENQKPIDPVFLNNIAVIYFDTHKTDEAMTLCMEALECAKSQGNNIQSLILSNIAGVYLESGDVESALEFNNQAFDVLRGKAEDSHYLAACYNTFGMIYTESKQWDRALENFEKCLKIYRDKGQKYNEALQLIDVGNFYMMQEKFDESIDCLHKALSIGKETASEGVQLDSYRLLSQCFEKCHDYKKAYEYLTYYNELNEKIKTKELSDRLSAQMTELRIEKAQKDAEIQRLKNIELKHQAEESALKAKILAESYRDIKIIGEIGQKITSTLDFKKVNRLIYKNIQKLMDADGFGICLYKESEGSIDFKMYIENEKRLPLLHIAVDNEKSLAAECIRTKKELLLNEVSEDGRLLMQREGMPVLHPKSIIYYPLLLENKVIGAITVQSSRANAYTERSMEMLKALASYMAIAIYNSQQSEELKEKSKELELLSKTDALTGLFNRRHIMDRMDEESYRYDRAGHNFCVAILDIDHFKEINDIYGHSCGDYVLVQLAKIFNRLMRKQDVLARWGGEEFLIMLPDTDLQGALALCERMRGKLEEKRFTYNKKKIKITATFGVAQYNSEQGIDTVISNADNALYVGKNKGRNCVIS